MTDALRGLMDAGEYGALPKGNANFTQARAA
jgi:hypothetical protein